MDDLEQDAKRFDALSYPVRLYLLHLIIKHGGMANVDELVDLVANYQVVAQPTVSHHLRILSDAGFIKGRRNGLEVFYYALPEALLYCQDALGMIGESRVEARAS